MRFVYNRVMLSNKLKIVLFESQNMVLRALLKARFERNQNNRLLRIGNSYSGYWFPEQFLKSKGTIWGIGLGHDSTFELEMLSNGYRVIGFEPEEQCFADSLAQLNSKNSTIFKIGLWDKNGHFGFTGDNYSLVDIFDKGDFHDNTFEIRSLWEVAEELDLGNQQSPRVLRMNIEGAEREILNKFIDDPLPFEMIIFQAEFLFHLPFRRITRRLQAFRELWNILKALRKQDWQILGINRHQITVIAKTELNKRRFEWTTE